MRSHRRLVGRARVQSGIDGWTELVAVTVGCRHQATCWRTSARATARTIAARATSASASSSRWPTRRPSRARSCRAWRGSGSVSAPARHQRAARHGLGAGRPRAATTRSPRWVALGRDHRRGARLHRSAARAGDAAPDRRPVPGARAHGQRRAAAQGRRRRRPTWPWRVSAGPTRRAPHAGHAPRRKGGKAWIAISSSGCARCVSRVARARGVPPYVIFHDTTLRELAAAQADEASTRCGTSTAWAPRRPTTWAPPCSRRLARRLTTRGEPSAARRTSRRRHHGTPSGGRRPCPSARTASRRRSETG